MFLLLSTCLCSEHWKYSSLVSIYITYQLAAVQEQGTGHVVVIVIRINPSRLLLYIHAYNYNVIITVTINPGGRVTCTAPASVKQVKIEVFAPTS